MQGRQCPTKTAQTLQEKFDLHLHPLCILSIPYSVRNKPLQMRLRMPEVQCLHTTQPKLASKLPFVAALRCCSELRQIIKSFPAQLLIHQSSSTGHH